MHDLRAPDRKRGPSGQDIREMYSPTAFFPVLSIHRKQILPKLADFACISAISCHEGVFSRPEPFWEYIATKYCHSLPLKDALRLDLAKQVSFGCTRIRNGHFLPGFIQHSCTKKEDRKMRSSPLNDQSGIQAPSKQAWWQRRLPVTRAEQPIEPVSPLLRAVGPIRRPRGTATILKGPSQPCARRDGTGEERQQPYLQTAPETVPENPSEKPRRLPPGRSARQRPSSSRRSGRKAPLQQQKQPRR